MLEGKDVKQFMNWVYLGGTASENGRVEVEVPGRIQGGAIFFQEKYSDTEGVMVDRKICRKFEGKS